MGIFPDENINVFISAWRVYYKEKRKQKLVLTVTLVGRISLITPTVEKHNKVKQDMIHEMYASKE